MDRLAELGVLADALLDLLHDVNAQRLRETLCTHALDLSEATAALVYEPTVGALARTAATGKVGVQVPKRVVLDSPAPSPVLTAWREQRPVLVGQPTADQVTDAAPVGWPDLHAGLFVPVGTADRRLGLLVVTWPAPLASAPVVAQALLPVLATAAAVAIDRAELLQRLADEAMTDPLTGVLNRRAWLRAVQQEIARCRRTQATFSVAVLDLDGFKAHNDRFGHGRGDDLLIGCTRAWEGALRECDVLARLGGDEFAILVGHPGNLDPELFLQRVAHCTPGAVSVSVGSATWDGNESTDELLARADEALYERKRAKLGILDLRDPDRAIVEPRRPPSP